MMIERLELSHFRNYDRLFLEPHPGINIFFGQNGSGKTNLLEAIHYCSLGKSHRVNQDVNAVQFGESGAMCRVSIQGKYTRNDIEVRLQPGSENVKSIWIDRKKVNRFSEMMGVLRCVIFSPEDLGLIKDGPSGRRRFLDMMISQVNRGYFIALQQYRIAMNQRNAILKTARTENKSVDPMIAVFEEAMSIQAQIIYEERQKVSELLSEKGRQVYCQISGKDDEDFTIQFLPSIREKQSDTEYFQKVFRESREDDLRLGNTSAGPHRDDLGLFLNRKNMKMYSSQGQTRTGALSLKITQMNIIARLCGEQPVLLLDDVMSELDLDRRMNLLRLIEGTQTFITCSDEGDLDSSLMHRSYLVHSSDEKASVELKNNGPVSEKIILKEPDFL